MIQTSVREAAGATAIAGGPRVTISCMANWYLHHTAKGLQERGGLCGFWGSTGNHFGLDKGGFRRIWPYYLLMKPFFHLPFVYAEEIIRWKLLPAYDVWVRAQDLPEDCNVVMGPMGSCLSLFELADAAPHRVLKVFDAPNSHPKWLRPFWQGECDKYLPGYKIPMPDKAFERIAEEIDSADMVLCPSLFVRDSMVDNGVPPEKCFVNHFGVDTSIFQPRTELPEVPVFVCVGNICLRKGHQYLFRAFEKVRETHPDARLVCIGSLRPDFRREWPKWKGLVEYHPSLPHVEIAVLLKNATAFVLASVEEGFARVLSEAMAAALPIIATYETGATTVVTDREEGLIVPARDIEALHGAMKRLAEDDGLNMAMGEKARQAGAVKNTWDDYAGRLYERLCVEVAEFHRVSSSP